MGGFGVLARAAQDTKNHWVPHLDMPKQSPALDHDSPKQEYLNVTVDDTKGQVNCKGLKLDHRMRSSREDSPRRDSYRSRDKEPLRV